MIEPRLVQILASFMPLLLQKLKAKDFEEPLDISLANVVSITIIFTATIGDAPRFIEKQ
jgi:hypothetical protein